MEYHKIIRLKNSKECCLRNAKESDGQILLDLFIKTHSETDYLRTYPEECTLTAEQESQFLKKMAESDNEIEIIAESGGVVIGTAGINAVGGKYKERHRADFGVSILKDYWGLGAGRALLLACIECAQKAGYVQLELTAVVENKNAIDLYKSVGFVEYGRNPRGFNSKETGFQEVIYMLLDLQETAAGSKKAE